MTMKITVILCTYNRCRSLAKALESVAAQIFSKSVEWEVLVVDNNSRDETREVVEELDRRHPGRFRYLLEQRSGKSYALNAGISEARGDILAFMDDDVTVEPTWLQNLTTALDNGEWVGSGGRILPERNFSPPRWLPLTDRYGLAPLAVFDPGIEAGPLAESPFGTNMAFQKNVFERHGGFRTDLGPHHSGASPQKSEDSEFGHRLLAAGEPLRYEPSAVVYHSVPQNRVRKAYFLAWWFDKARSDIRAFGIPSDANWRLGGIPLVMFRRLAVWTVRWMVTFEPSRRFSCKLKVWAKMGEIFESCRQLRGAKRQRDGFEPVKPDSRQRL
jgi:glycosyltransferase involved in cell wall biosynthesis